MKLYALFILMVLVSSCSTSVRSEGSKHQIQCMGAVSDCHEQARSLCPDGYLVTNRVRPQKVNGDTQYTLNVKCREPVFY